MDTIFWNGFFHTAEALARIFLIILLAGFLVRKKIITTEQIDGLSKITVIVLLPALVFSNTLQHFEPEYLSYWWILPLLGIGLSILGLVLAFLMFLPDYHQKKDLLALASMQNAGYLVLPVGQVIYPEHFTDFAILTFLFILGYNPVLWTLGKYLVTVQKNQKISFELKKIITPPAAANIISLLLVILGWQHIFPDTLVQSVDFLGKAAVPVATFVLGATLGTISLRKLPALCDIFRVIFIKYLLIPVLVIGILYFFEIYKNYPLLSDFLVIQAAVAPATGLILQVRAYGGNREKIAGIMFIAYIFCLIMLPFWLAFWHQIIV
jgi:predicted permease